MPTKIVRDEYTVATDRISRPYRLCVVADLHGAEGAGAVSLLSEAAPDLILAAGDICEDLTGAVSPRDAGLRFLRAAARLAPVFYTPGNHEYHRSHRNRASWKSHAPVLSAQARAILREDGVSLLEDEFRLFGEFCIGGLCPGDRHSDGLPSSGFLKEMEQSPGFRILLCHQPEYYPIWIRGKNVDLTVSGHAHGGQWRLFGHGIYAPGQGLFPQYTRGLYDGSLYVSPGLSNSVLVPRLFNPRSFALIHLTPLVRG